MDKPNSGRPVIMIAEQEDGGVKVTGYIPNEAKGNSLLDKARIDLEAQFTAARIRRVNNSGGLIQKVRNRFK